MRNFIILFITFIITILILPFLVLRRTLIDSNNINEFYRDIAVELDKIWCLLIWRVKGHTVSAMVYKLQKKWAIKIIDWLFKDEPNHCYNQWVLEFGGKL